MASNLRIGTRLRDQRGFALMELLVTLPLMVVVTAAGFGFYQFAAREQQGNQVRGQSLVEQRNGLEEMTRLLRETNYVGGAPSIVVTDRLVVAQTCDLGSCQLTLFNCDGIDSDQPLLRVCVIDRDLTDGDPPREVVRGVMPASGPSPPPIFTRVDSPDAVGVDINLRVSTRGVGEATMLLDDGVTLRNATFTS